MQTKAAGGFSLIEVLAAVLVLAIGVLGAARAQLAAQQTRHQTALVSAGVQLAGSLADRMRANARHMQGGDALNAYLQLDYDALATGAPSPPGTLCFAAADCSDAHMAAFDIYDITAALQIADTVWVLGREQNEAGQPIPGARIRASFNLVERGLAWHENITAMPEFMQVRQEIRALFPTL